jgi:putative transcriptional regulator
MSFAESPTARRTGRRVDVLANHHEALEIGRRLAPVREQAGLPRVARIGLLDGECGRSRCNGRHWSYKCLANSSPWRAKARKEDLTPDEKRAVRKLAAGVEAIRENPNGMRMSKFGQELLKSMKQAAAHARGRKVREMRMTKVEIPDVKAIRRSLRMSQQRFAAAYRIPLANLKNWEQGRRHPDAPAAAYLLAIKRRPKEIMEAFAR